MKVIMLFTILCPLIMGVILYHPKFNNSKLVNILSLLTSSIVLIFNILLSIFKTSNFKILDITTTLSIVLKADNISVFFSILISFMWVIVNIYSIKYFEKKESNKFFTFYLTTLAMLMQLCYSHNLLTMYLSFEMITLSSMPLVMYDKSRKSISAALKYLYYSFGGAFLGLFGVFIAFYFSTPNAMFTIGGNIDLGKLSNSNTIFQIGVFISLIGFSVKAGLFPLNDWLPTAHPVAPSPASAVLSGVITKSSILVIYRYLYETIGVNLIKGTWVQEVWIYMILLTILIGSIITITQDDLKKRLAYSSISQLSYILLGLSIMSKEALIGAFLHVIVHASIKICLFLTAGNIISVRNYRQISKLDGIGKELPITMICYTIAAIALIGIPPMGGFISKWYLIDGALSSSLDVLKYIVAMVLLISAIFTAIYLLPLSINGFIPKDKNIIYIKKKESLLLVIPILILIFIVLFIGIYPTPIVNWLSNVVGEV